MKYRVYIVAYQCIDVDADSIADANALALNEAQGNPPLWEIEDSAEPVEQPQ